MILPQPIDFESNSEKLKPSNDKTLQYVKEYLVSKNYVSKLRIEVHTDKEGKSAQKPTEKRALSVAQWLIKNGIDCKRLIITGFGNTKTIADNKTLNGKLANNRVTFINAAIRGQAISTMSVDGGGVVVENVCD